MLFGQGLLMRMLVSVSPSSNVPEDKPWARDPETPMCDWRFPSAVLMEFSNSPTWCRKPVAFTYHLDAEMLAKSLYANTFEVRKS